jgi:hypothetical protein
MKYRAQAQSMPATIEIRRTNIKAPWKNPRGARLPQFGQVVADLPTNAPHSLHGVVAMPHL